MNTLTFSEAVVYVLEHRQEPYAAWGFAPQQRGGKVVGGDIYVVAYSADTEGDEEDPPYLVHLSGGLFNSSSGEEESYGPEDVPTEAKGLCYTPISNFDAGNLDYETQVALKLLQGVPKEDALAD